MPDLPILDGCEPMSADGGPHGVLVLHGFTGCPQSVKPLARPLADAGFTVDVPLLPGHGTTLDDMLATGWDDWSAAADRAYSELAARCDRVLVVGLSMGGGLAAWLGARHPEVAGLACINPIIGVGDDVTGFVGGLIDAGEDRMDAIGGDIADPDGHEAGYGQTPLAPLLSMAAGLAAMRPTLGDVACPLLLLTSPQDHVVPPVNSDELADLVGGGVERISLERSFHVATLDYDQGLIEAEVVAFARRVTGLA